ncbi:unnamed protein product [Amoebophrya sp. A25]|nr:unnamed protein product [Amoebophrya sp. A25]|eukprot:GSA25T00014777001.1
MKMNQKQKHFHKAGCKNAKGKGKKKDGQHNYPVNGNRSILSMVQTDKKLLSLKTLFSTFLDWFCFSVIDFATQKRLICVVEGDKDSRSTSSTTTTVYDPILGVCISKPLRQGHDESSQSQSEIHNNYQRGHFVSASNRRRGGHDASPLKIQVPLADEGENAARCLSTAVFYRKIVPCFRDARKTMKNLTEASSTCWWQSFLSSGAAQTSDDDEDEGEYNYYGKNARILGGGFDDVLDEVLGKHEADAEVEDKPGDQVEQQMSSDEDPPDNFYVASGNNSSSSSCEEKEDSEIYQRTPAGKSSRAPHLIDDEERSTVACSTNSGFGKIDRGASTSSSSHWKGFSSSEDEITDNEDGHEQERFVKTQPPANSKSNTNNTSNKKSRKKKRPSRTSNFASGQRIIEGDPRLMAARNLLSSSCSTTGSGNKDQGQGKKALVKKPMKKKSVRKGSRNKMNKYE